MHTTANTQHLIRSNLWSNQLRDLLKDDLMAMNYVEMIDFPEGDTLNIASIGQAEALDYAEDQAIQYSSLDTGNFTFSITDYKQSGHYITNKTLQDSFLASRLIAEFVPSEHRAIMKGVEIDIFDKANASQTASDVNNINGGRHRLVAGGTNQKIEADDFAKARYALKQANVPDQNLIAIVDPSVEFEMNTIANAAGVSYNPRWEGIIESGIAVGTHFIANIGGFDVYTSQNLKAGIAETVDSVAITNGVSNLFFSATSGLLPFIGAFRQMPKVDSEYNKDYQREEYVTTARYGFKVQRPDNLVCVLSDNSQVYA